MSAQRAAPDTATADLEGNAPVYAAAHGGLPPARCGLALESFLKTVRHEDFACLLGRSVVSRGQFVLTAVRGEMDGAQAAADAAPVLRRFVDYQDGLGEPFSVAVVAFPDAARDVEPEQYEELLFGFLQNLHAIDESPWDTRYGSDPNVWGFGFSFAGRGWFPIGLHPNSPRIDRRTVMPMVVFNALWQFRHLDEAGMSERMHVAIRERELRRNELVMPLPGECGAVSGAAQYSGIQPREGWECPFHASVSVPGPAPPEWLLAGEPAPWLALRPQPSESCENGHQRSPGSVATSRTGSS